MKKYSEIFLLLSLSSILSIIVIKKIPFSVALTIYYTEALKFIEKGIIESDFYQIGYTGFIGTIMKLFGLHGLVIFQALLYVSVIILSYYILKIKQIGSKLRLIGCCFLCFHPYLLINITRIMDHNLTIPLFLCYLLLLLYIKKKGFFSYKHIVILGIVSGLMVCVRPNLISLLIIPIIFILFFNKRIYIIICKMLVYIIVVLLSMGVISFRLKGKFFFFPKNGGYNFFVGANTYTKEALLRHYNAEPSIPMKFNELKISFDTPNIDKLYWKLGFEYILKNPIEYLFLCVLKIFTLFRPDYRRVDQPTGIDSYFIKTFLQTIMTLPFIVWLILLFINFKHRDNIILWTVILYILPIIATNSDPRFRLPLDIIFILDSLYYLNRIFKKLN